MAIVELHFKVRRFLPIVALIGIFQSNPVNAQIKLSPGRVPIGDNELNSPIDEPQVTIDEHSSNAVMRPTPLAIQQAKDPLVKLVYETRDAQRRRLLSTAEHTPWQIMHGMLALREDFLIRHNGQPVSCLEWIKTGPTFENESWFQKTQVRVLTGRGGNNAWEMMTVGRGHPYNKPYAFEGHINQFVAILSMSGVPLETQFNTPQGPVSMRDMLTYAKMTVNEKEEVTWTLWALSRYLPPDAEWTNAQGEKWSIERLVKIEVGKSLQGAPCGGTHGLFALAHARNVYLRSGKPLVGVWQEAEQKIRRYIQTARMQQNSNGTLSSNYFRGREFKQDFDKRMASSGHLLEFLMMALPTQELNAPWVRRAIEATSNDLMANRKAFVSCSPLYHATSALSIYLDRITAVAPNIAQGAPKTHTISNSKEVKTADALLDAPVVETPEAVKTPVMESSGVDSNGAPKALTAPILIVPDAPVPDKIDAGESGENVPPAEGEEKSDMNPAPTAAAKGFDLKTESAASVPAVVPEAPAAAVLPAVTLTPTPAPARSSDNSLTTVVSGDKIRVFGPQPAPQTDIVSETHIESPPQIADTEQTEIRTPSIGTEVPSTPVPPVPLPADLQVGLPEDQPVPTPVADLSAEQPDLLIPLTDAINPKLQADGKDHPPAEQPKEKKRERWRATPPERRKVIVVGEKFPAVKD